ncbi:hypothetical protein BD410DRAFT_729914 [Rickenella mellea]|uniref:Uncharacterized protein n=1 Tax=Rickenella mellea TaxID=50990 RepID=A0A4Y7PRS3_9AGAM|nr:hypothetical protein BD410DRAFT_729914 [Rickenella mellea]
MKTEQEQQAKAARTTSKDQVQRAWQNYEVGWATLKDRPTLHFKTIPWPTLKVPTSPEDLSTNTIGPFLLSPHHSQAKSNRDRIKEQLLRWHPDRFEGKWMTKVAQSDKDMVKEAVGQVVRSLNELNTRENSPFA